jgi:AcrR family transcriptional regulator
MKMKSNGKLSGVERRADILKAVRKVFVEKGFDGATTRDLARAAGVSEALLYKHFPSKKAIYSAIQQSCFGQDREIIIKQLEAMRPSTQNLVVLVEYLFSRLFDDRLSDDDVRAMIHLMLRSVMDEGEFARFAFKHGPLHWVSKVEECLKAAVAAGDAVNGGNIAKLGGWFAHHLAAMIMINLLHAKPVIDYGVPQKKLQEQAVLFTLRGMGLKDKAIAKYYNPKTMKNVLAW